MNTQTSNGDLSQFDRLFEAAETRGGDSLDSSVPDGEYSVLIEQADLTRSQTSGSNMLVWRMRIQAGEFSGRTIRKHRVITERTIPWLKEELVKCGLKLDRLSDLPKHINELPGRELNVLKRTRDGNSNVYIQWSGPRPMHSDDDLPF